MRRFVARPCWFLVLVLAWFAPPVARGDGASREVSRAQICYSKQDWAGAIKHLDWVLERYPDRAQVWTLRGYTRLQQREYRPALADFDQAIALQLHNIDVVMGRAQALQGLQAWEAMVAELTPMIQAHPDDGRLRALRADALVNQNEWTRARVDLDQAIALKIDDAQTLAERGLCLLALKQPNAATADLDRAVQLEPDRFDYQFTRIAALLMTRRYDEAVRSFDPIATAPERATILFFRGAARFCQHDYAGALADWDAQIQLEPQKAEVWTNRALAHLLLKQDAAAMTDADEAVRLDPKHPGVWNNRAVVASMQRQYTQAMADADEAVRLAPRSAGFLANRAGLRLELRDWAGALADYNRAADLDPGDLASDQGRALIRAAAPDARLRNGLQALALANRACERTDDADPRSLHAQAAAHAELGNYARAAAIAERALKLPPLDRTEWQVHFRAHRYLELIFISKIRDEDAFRAELTRALAQYRAGQPYRKL